MTTTYSITAGSGTFTVPQYEGLLQIYFIGGGGGGAGRGADPLYNYVAPGSAGDTTSVTIPGVGTFNATGGNGGGVTSGGTGGSSNYNYGCTGETGTTTYGGRGGTVAGASCSVILPYSGARQSTDGSGRDGITTFLDPATGSTPLAGGAGGGAKYGLSGYSGGGSGGRGYLSFAPTTVAPGTVISYTVGAGGAGGNVYSSYKGGDGAVGAIYFISTQVLVEVSGEQAAFSIGPYQALEGTVFLATPLPALTTMLGTPMIGAPAVFVTGVQSTARAFSLKSTSSWAGLSDAQTSNWKDIV